MGAAPAPAGGNIGEAILGGFQEVMNICGTLFMSDQTPHLRLKQVAPRKDAVGLADLKKAATRKDFQVTVPKYGSGQIAFVVS